MRPSLRTSDLERCGWPAHSRGTVPIRLARRSLIPPLVRQLKDPLGLRMAAQSKRSETLTPRIKDADRVVKSVCPYCAVGRGQLCPKGAGSLGFVKSPLRETKVKYRRPHGTEWEELDLETAMDMIADRVVKTRDETWQATNDKGEALNRTLGIAGLGGATLDSEENYLLKKSFTAMGAVSIENQARI